MTEYEALFIIDPNKAKDLKEILGSITSSITKGKGKISKEENEKYSRVLIEEFSSLYEALEMVLKKDAKVLQTLSLPSE